MKKVKGRVFRKTKGASYLALWVGEHGWNVVARVFTTEVEALQVVSGFRDNYGKEPEIAIVEFKL